MSNTNTTTTTNMLLVIPAIDHAGNNYAQLYNDAMDRVDSHDHTEGFGVRITPAGININATLEFNGQAADELARVQFSETTGILSGAAYANSIHFYNDEAYLVDGAGNSIQLSANGNVNITASGGWSGLSSPAVARYNGPTSTFSLLQHGANDQAGILDVGNVRIRTTTAGASVYTTIAASASQASNHTVTLWTALPASTSVVTMTSAGQLTNTRALSVDSVATATVTTTGDVTVGDDLTVTDDATIGGAFAVNGDATFNGNVTLPDGTGLNHGTRFLQLSAHSWSGEGSGTLNVDGYWESTTAGSTLTIALPLTRGDRITSIEINGLFGGTGARDRVLRRRNAATGTDDIWSSSASVTSGASSITLTDTAYTLIAGDYFTFRFSSLAASDNVNGITITYDRP